MNEKYILNALHVNVLKSVSKMSKVSKFRPMSSKNHWVYVRRISDEQNTPTEE